MLNQIQGSDFIRMSQALHLYSITRPFVSKLVATRKLKIYKLENASYLKRSELEALIVPAEV